MSASRAAPPWLFGITAIPFGVSAGFVATTMPYVLRKAGLSVEAIGWYSSAAMVPSFAQFLYAPVIDVGPRRKHWLLLVSVLGALCLGAALLLPLPSSASTFLTLTFLGQVVTGLVGSCNGGLLATTLAPEQRGRASGWLNAGNLGGGALGAGLTLYLAERSHPQAAALILMSTMILPAVAALAIPEERRAKRGAIEVFRSMLRDTWKTAKSRPGWTGILFCISPVGTAALLNFFSAIAVDYQATPKMVAFVNGTLNGLVTAAGSLLGGQLCDRLDKRLCYLLSGALLSVVGVSIMMAPIRPMTYAVGVTAYFFVSGLCYAAFSAVVLESIGRAGASASTQYTLFSAAGNFAITYVGWINTRFHQHGPQGLWASDALLNLGGVVILALMMKFVFNRKEATSNHFDVAA
jgi:PAT family beta-lactamase induction signal transducer AmpG